MLLDQGDGEIPHHHCGSCNCCALLHTMIDGRVLCFGCQRRGTGCSANKDQTKEILAGQFIDINRRYILEVGI